MEAPSEETATVTSNLRSLAVAEASDSEKNPEASENAGAEEEEEEEEEESAAADDDEDDEEWGVPCSDEEEPSPEKWLPPPAEIRRLYDIIAQTGSLPLRRNPLPRRAPTPEPDSEEERGSAGQPESEEEEEEKPPAPTEFDFDDEPVAPKNSLIDRRRAPGGASLRPSANSAHRRGSAATNERREAGR
ncbi:PAXIP1-associated glutamate-rich protein 1 [Grus japonensis]|uniref:PAXIP1-associated glutamate-rich protein 1 n=1 Tax=Grus japonensis TaxID=30415 RepID=A0ABC9XXL9_GRUJA